MGVRTAIKVERCWLRLQTRCVISEKQQLQRVMHNAIPQAPDPFDAEHAHRKCNSYNCEFDNLQQLNIHEAQS